MYAVAKIKGRQYKLEEGAIVYVDLMQLEPGESVSVDEICLLSKDDEVLVGTPHVEGAKASATVLGEAKDRKIEVRKFRSKRNEWHKHQGHRQRYTKLRIDKIVG